MTWTVEELARECARVLADEPQPSGRVNDVPDLRTIRYYAALGLLDPPRKFDRKKALYEERHLHQLIAIKRLQRSGLALAEIQARLAGATDAKLRALANAPSGAADAPPAPPTRERFWTRAPAAVRAFKIAPGVTLVVDATPRPFTDDDAAALRGWLERRGLAAKGEI